MQLSVLICLGYGLSLAIALLVFATPIAELMTGGDGAAPYTAQYLRVVGWGFFGYGILITANAAMNARDRALWSMGLSAARIAVTFIPFAWVGVWLLGYTGVLLAALAANVVGAWAALIATRATGLFHLDWWFISLPARHIARTLPTGTN